MVEERLPVEESPFHYPQKTWRIADVKSGEGLTRRGRSCRISNERDATMLVAPETDRSRAARQRQVPKSCRARRRPDATGLSWVR